MTNSRLLRSIGPAEIAAQAERAASILEQARRSMFSPHLTKQAPQFTSAQLIALMGGDYDKNKFVARHRKGDLPRGTQEEGRRFMFSVADVRAWSRAIRAEKMRPPGAEAVVLTVANFKGGVGKTTLSMTLAQSLALRGHRVLAIDLDPQASFTALFGYQPDQEISADMTALPIFSGDSDDILSSRVPETYWPGLDLVPASTHLFGAEFQLPSRQMRNTDFQFWRVLDASLKSARKEYDVIVIDTPPSLSYTTINAVTASDGVLIPMPMSALAFASSVSFWELFSTMYESFAGANDSKRFHFIDIVATQTSTHASSLVIREWAAAAYAERLLPVEIPSSAAVETAAKEFSAVYDVPRELTSTRTFRRVIDAFDSLALILEEKMTAVWAQRAAEADADELLEVPA